MGVSSRLQARPGSRFCLHSDMIGPACLSRNVMRGRETTFIGVAAAGVLALVAAAFWPSRCPVDVKLVRMEGSGVVDDDGTEAWLLTLSISNRSGGVLNFPREKPGADASVNSLWVGAQSISAIDDLMPGKEKELLVVVPFRADSCRLQIRYLAEPLKLRLTRALGTLGMWRHSWSRALGKRVFPVGWVQPLRSDYVGRSPRWRLVSPEVPLGARPIGRTGISRPAHNEPVQATAATLLGFGDLGDSLLLGFVLGQSPAAVPDFSR